MTIQCSYVICNYMRKEELLIPQGYVINSKKFTDCWPWPLFTVRSMRFKSRFWTDMQSGLAKRATKIVVQIVNECCALVLYQIECYTLATIKKVEALKIKPYMVHKVTDTQLFLNYKYFPMKYSLIYMIILMDFVYYNTIRIFAKLCLHHKLLLLF